MEEGPCNKASVRLLPGLKRLLGGTRWAQTFRQVPRVPPEVRQQIVGLPPFALFALTAGAQQKTSARATTGAERNKWPGRVRWLAVRGGKEAGMGLSRC